MQDILVLVDGLGCGFGLGHSLGLGSPVQAYPLS
jgi:hypothetical protein